VIYLIFNEGTPPPSARNGCAPIWRTKAIRLARMLAALAPDEPEVLSLQALLEIQGSRMPARLDEDGTPILLEAQDRTLWDQLQIRRGMVALEKAERLAGRGTPVGRYFLQASIAAQHARAVHAEDTDWRRIAELYDVLGPCRTRPDRRSEPGGRARAGVRPPGRAGRVGGMDADSLGDSPLVSERDRGPARAAGLHAQAREAFTEAASRAGNVGERTVLQRRAARNWSPGSD